MPIKDRIKDLITDVWSKNAIVILFIALWKLNFLLFKETENSTINAISSISWSNIYWMFVLIFFLCYTFLFISHEILKMIGIENKGDLRFSAIISILLLAFLFIRNLMIILTPEQFDLTVTLIGFPFLTTIPSLFRKILTTFSKKGNSEFISVGTDNQIVNEQPKKNYNRKFHKLR